jgi:hypothetical protein
MFNPFRWLDGVLLNTAQKFCDKFQSITGLTKFRLEKWALITSAIFFGGLTILLTEPILAVLALMYVPIAAFTVRAIEKVESEFLKNGSLIMPIWNLPVRLTFTSVQAFSAYLSFSVNMDYKNQMACYGIVAVILWMYLSSCVPRPPSKSKMREWYEKALTWLNNQVKPAPAPAS